MTKRVRSQRRATSQRVMAAIVRGIEEERFCANARERATVPIHAIIERADVRDPVDIAKAVSEAMRRSA